MDTMSVDLRRKPAASAPARAGFHPIALVGLWLERARSRRQLRLLLSDPHALADLGLSPDEVDLESLKPFWR